MLVALDIETITPPGKGVTQADIDHFLENYTSKYKTQAAIEKHKALDLERFKTRKNLQAGSPQIIAVGLARIHPYNFHIEDLEACVSDSPKVLAEFYANYLEKTHSLQGFLGYNLEAFDLLHLCNALDEFGIDSLLKATKFGIVDPCVWPLQRKYKLKDICNAFRIKSEDENLNIMDGSDMAEAYEAGNYELIKSYCELDVWRVCRLFRSLSRMWRLVQ